MQCVLPLTSICLSKENTQKGTKSKLTRNRKISWKKYYLRLISNLVPWPKVYTQSFLLTSLLYKNWVSLPDNWAKLCSEHTICSPMSFWNYHLDKLFLPILFIIENVQSILKFVYRLYLCSEDVGLFQRLSFIKTGTTRYRQLRKESLDFTHVWFPAWFLGRTSTTVVALHCVSVQKHFTEGWQSPESAADASLPFQAGVDVLTENVSFLTWDLKS